MLEKEKLNIVDEELIVSICKAVEIFDTMKNTRIKLNGELINGTDKRYLSLLLGIYFTKNEVSKILRLLRYNYDIEVHTVPKRDEEYEKLYNEYFNIIMDDLITEKDNYIEDFMLNLIAAEFIKKIHKDKGLSLMPVKLLLHESLKNKEKAKTLQKI